MERFKNSKIRLRYGKMIYESDNPGNQPYVEEICGMRDFNNLHCNLPAGENSPEGLYRHQYRETLEWEERPDYSERFPLWASIDTFVAETGFDVDAYWTQFKEDRDLHSNPEEGKPSQLMLCPMYIYLRKEGHSKELMKR